MRIYNRLMEVFWLAAAVFTAIVAIYLINNVGFSEGGVWLAMPVVSIVMWYLRRKFRKRMQQQQEDQQNGAQ